MVDKPAGIPDSWPAEVRELGESSTLPDASGEWQLMTEEEFNIYKGSVQAEYDAWHSACRSEEIAIQKTEALMKACMTFSQGVMIRFSAENVRLGITQDGKTGEVLTKLQPMINALSAGSLLEAITRLEAIPVEDYDSKFINAARITRVVNEIKDFLNISHS